MRLALATASVVLLLGSGCRASLPDPVPPGPVPEIGQHDLTAPEDFEAAQDDVERSAQWLLSVEPEDHPDQWVERRDLVMDWIENHPTLGYQFVPAIMAPVHKDRRFWHSMYMNMAYAIGKARYLQSTETPDPVEAEVAALEVAAQYYAMFKAKHPKPRARKFERLLRKKKKGKLREWIGKELLGG